MANIWLPASFDDTADPYWLRAVHGALEDAAEAAGDGLGGRFKRDTVQMRYTCTWGDQTLGCGITATEAILDSLPEMKTSVLRAAAVCLQQAVEEIVELKRKPDWSEVIEPKVAGERATLDARWQTAVGVVALWAYADELDARAPMRRQA